MTETKDLTRVLTVAMNHGSDWKKYTDILATNRKKPKVDIEGKRGVINNVQV